MHVLSSPLCTVACDAASLSYSSCDLLRSPAFLVVNLYVCKRVRDPATCRVFRIKYSKIARAEYFLLNLRRNHATCEPYSKNIRVNIFIHRLARNARNTSSLGQRVQYSLILLTSCCASNDRSKELSAAIYRSRQSKLRHNCITSRGRRGIK